MKLTNKKASLKCDRCYHYFSYKKMYAIGQSQYGHTGSRCWEITMSEIQNEHKKS